MSTTDLIPDVTDYLLAQCQASATLSGLGVKVCDGEVPKTDLAGVEQVLWIGHNPLSPTPEFGTSAQSFAYLGNDATRRWDDGVVECAAKHWTGNTAMQVHRDGVKAIVAVVELLLRGTPPSGPGDSSMGNLVVWSEVTEATWSQRLVGSNGAEATCAFKVSFKARLS